MLGSALQMLGSALVQETVSRGVSFVLCKREEKASQGHLMERLEMAVSEMESALERAQELPIRHPSLIGRRKKIKSAYVEAMELLDKHHQQQTVPARQELQDAQGVKRKRSVICFTSSSAGLSTYDVRRFEWYADCAGKFVRDVVSGCSLHHNTFCSPIVRHLLEGKTLWHANLVHRFYIWPMYSDERGLEAVLEYCYEDCTMNEKYFILTLVLRLSESTDIVGVATKGLQLLTSEFNLATEYAMGELTLLSSLQDITHSYGPPWVGIQDWHIECTQCFRPDPACCKGSRHRLCANNNVSSELSNIFPEQVICWSFHCCWVQALEPSRLSCSSFDAVGRSKSRGGGKPRLLLTSVFLPHYARETQDSYAVEIMGDVREYIVPSMQQVAEALNKSDAINCFIRQPELTEYKIHCNYKHGWAGFKVEKASTKRVGTPKTKRYNTRGSTRRSSRG